MTDGLNYYNKTDILYIRFSVGSGTGSSNNAKVSVKIPVTLQPGKNTIDLLSLTVGLQVFALLV